MADLKQAGDRHRARAKERSRERSQDAAEIGPPPAVVDPERKERCRFSLYHFLVEYFPNSTGLSPLSEDHKRAIEAIQIAILEGGNFINAVYRGFAKTTISENAALWAVVYGHCRYVGIIGASEPQAVQNIESIQMELCGNDLLYEDFPEVCHPIVALENKFQRCKSQTCQGELTHIKWNSDKIVLPTVRIDGERTPSSGAIVHAKGFDGKIRGLKHKRIDGVNQRPDFVIIDDIQDDKTAVSGNQVTKQLKTINNTILNLAGQLEPLSAVINATILEVDDVVDQLLDHEKHPEWEGVRVSMVKQWADRHDDLWMDQYKRILTTYDPGIPGDAKRAEADATAFYKRRRKKMDAGCIVSWDECYEKGKKGHEISAIQHAYNKLIELGEDGFAAECQQKPNRADESAIELLPQSTIAKQMSDWEQSVVPPGCRTVTMGVDVHKQLLYYTISAISDQFDVYVIEYGTYPEQKRRNFLLRNARPTIQDLYPDMSEEEQIKKAVLDFLNLQMPRQFFNPNREERQIKFATVDTAWGVSAEPVRMAISLCEHRSRIYPVFGQGLGPNDRPMLSLPMKDGEFRSTDNAVPWRILHSQQSIGTQSHALFDSNAVKTFLHNRLKTPRGSPGSMYIYKSSRPHTLYAEHLVAEKCKLNEGKHRKANEWKLPSSKPDNHWLDTTNMCIVCGSMAGITLLGDPVPEKSKPKRRGKRCKRKKVSYL